MERHLVIFTVGPVQSFIASARKIEDLWSGSYLLSHLIREALRELYKDEDTFQLVFPVITKQEIENPNKNNLHIASLPNRFTAVLKGDTQEVIQRLKETEHRVKQAFYDVGEKAIQKLFSKLPEKDHAQLIKTTHKQIDSLLEMYWVIEPYKNDQEFKLIRDKLESRMGALKNDKLFPQLEQHGLTCSVCKERDALSAEPISETDRYGKMKRKLADTWNQRNERFKEGSQRIRDNEFLCGICTGKRLARDYFQEYYQSSKSFPSFESVKKIAGDEQNYYGILMMDGDNMGKWFSGDRAEDYSEISEKLASFALNTVPNIIEKKFPGRLIYAGGDDVLAFMPVDQALKAANAIRFAFSNEVDGLGKDATASAGLVIAHETAPLQGLLNEVRKLESKAKSYQKFKDGKTVETKNALAIGLHTRSGEIAESILPWSLTEKETVEVLTNVIELLKEELSSTFIHHFIAAFSPLLHPRAELKYTKISSHEMVEAELRRLIIRSAKKPLSAERLKQVVDQLLQLHDSVPTTLDFIFLLKMMTFFKRKEELV